MKKNYVLKTGQYPSADGESLIAYYCFWPEGREPRAVLQISHGMCEYIMRYEGLADYLTGLGYFVCGNDHAGHGKSADDEDFLGLTGGADAMVEDLHTLSLRVKKRFPNLPLILVGHSMGSFAARLYAAKYPTELDGLVIVGTGGPDNPTGLGKALAKLVAKIKGENHRSALITKIAFGSYNKHFRREGSSSAWLTRDSAVVKDYDKDPYCNYTFTAKGYYDLFDLIEKVSHKDWAPSLALSLPVLFLSGTEDPVGDYGRGVEKIYRRLIDAHMSDVRMNLYKDARHEVFNELGREHIYADLAAWLSEHNF